MKTNEELQKEVIAELKWDPQLKEISTQIGVSAKDGVVTLSGLVDNYGRKVAAEKAAQRVHGVKVVASDVEVKLGLLRAKTDTEIAEAVKNALLWNTAVDEDKIDVKVDNGWITLNGSVDWAYQKASVEDTVRDLAGVKGVSNAITIKSKSVDPKVIKEKIDEAFRRNAAIDAASVKIETAGSRVTLRGTVTSWVEKEEAERIAWSSPGVLTVDNRIEIDSEVFA